MSPKRPNIVMIVLDAVRRDHVSCYGYGRETTPNLDQIGAEGVVFDRAFSTSCWTLPSHASLFTGRYPSRHCVDLNSREIPPELPTLASLLGREGYRTASISCNGFITEHTGLTRGFDRVFDVEGLKGGDSGVGRVVRGIHRRWRRLTARDRGGSRATGLARRWIRNRGERPFFLFMNYMDCHLPYALAGPDRYRFIRGSDRDEADRLSQDPFAVMAGQMTMTRREIDLLKSLYDGALRYLDSQVGEVRRELERLGVLDDTIFIVTSDHGESFGEHGLMDHQFGLHEHLLAVPLIVRYPGWAKPGTRNDQLVQHVDLVPTLLSLAGHNESGAPLNIDGLDFTAGEVRTAVFGEYLEPNLRVFERRFPEVDVTRFDVSLRSVRRDRFKLVQRDDGRELVYDLQEDPDETRDVSEEREDIRRELHAILIDRLGEWSSASKDRSSTTPEDEMRQRLELLGYL